MLFGKSFWELDGVNALNCTQTGNLLQIEVYSE
jgi:hypothetical protein